MAIAQDAEKLQSALRKGHCLLVESPFIEEDVETFVILLEELYERLRRICRESRVVWRLEALCNRRRSWQREQNVQSLFRSWGDHGEEKCSN